MVTTPCDGCATATVGRSTRIRAITTLIGRVLFWRVRLMLGQGGKTGDPAPLREQCKRAAMGFQSLTYPRRGPFSGDRRAGGAALARCRLTRAHPDTPHETHQRSGAS